MKNYTLIIELNLSIKLLTTKRWIQMNIFLKGERLQKLRENFREHSWRLWSSFCSSCFVMMVASLFIDEVGKNEIGWNLRAWKVLKSAIKTWIVDIFLKSAEIDKFLFLSEFFERSIKRINSLSLHFSLKSTLVDKIYCWNSFSLFNAI